MKNRRYIIFIIVGGLLLVTGIFGVIMSYKFPVLPFMTITSWKDVIFSSGLSLAGLLIIIFSIKKSLSLKNESRAI
ncbi:hypothetical protein ACFL6G_07770 [candidate division KSB1 bacterium]